MNDEDEPSGVWITVVAMLVFAALGIYAKLYLL